jgi:hypothetical protein
MIWPKRAPVDVFFFLLTFLVKCVFIKCLQFYETAAWPSARALQTVPAAKNMSVLRPFAADDLFRFNSMYALAPH